MFKKVLATLLSLIICSLIALSASAAPVSGSLTVDIVIAPACADLIPNNATACDKIDDTIVKIEADIALTLSVSGLDISSLTVFTFKGVESQVFTITGTIGAMTFRDMFIFSPSLVEIEFTRDPITLATRYCINYDTPGDLTPPFLDCPSADLILYGLIEDVGMYHPAVANLILGVYFDNAGMLDASLELAKKIVDISINIAGLTLMTRALFANFSTGANITADSWYTGIVLGLEGQTVSGITLRSETWFGARQGLECWGECKPIERNYGGKVVTNFSAQEEKIFIRNLVLAGITNNFRVEFKFDQGPSIPSGLTYVEWNARFTLLPLNLNLSNTLRLNGNFLPQFDALVFAYKFGDMSVTAIFYAYVSVVGQWEAQLAEFITTFDPPGATITSDLILCKETVFVGSCLAGVLEHDIYLAASMGDVSINMRAIFYGLVTNFQELWVDIAFRVNTVTLKGTFVTATETVRAIGFSFIVRY
jgi:hypothetical protein